MANKKKPKVVKKTTKKVTRRRRKVSAAPVDSTIILEIDQVYKAINRVQLTFEPTTFMVLSNESAVIDNILRDLDLKYKKKDIKLSVTTQVSLEEKPVKEVKEVTEYQLDAPPKIEKSIDFDDMEEIPDELLEDGQLFY